MAVSDLAEVKGVGRRDKDQLQNPRCEGRASSPSRGEPGIVVRGVFCRGNRGDAELGFLGRGAGIMASGVLEVPGNMCRILHL